MRRLAAIRAGRDRVLYAADAEIVSIWAEVFGRTFHGRDGLLKWIRDFSAAFERPDLEYEHVADAGDQVVVFARIVGRGKASGAPFELATTHVWTIRAGRAMSVHAYRDRSEALEAAGLRE